MREFVMKEFVGELEKERTLCEKILSICEKALKESLEPRSVWLQEKKRYEKKISEIDRSLEVFKKLVNRWTN